MIVETGLSLMLIFSKTGLGFEQIYVKSEVLSEFEMNFIFCMDEATLHFDRALVVIIAFLCFKDEGVEIHLEIIVALRAFFDVAIAEIGRVVEHCVNIVRISPFILV